MLACAWQPPPARAGLTQRRARGGKARGLCLSFLSSLTCLPCCTVFRALPPPSHPACGAQLRAARRLEHPACGAQLRAARSCITGWGWPLVSAAPLSWLCGRQCPAGRPQVGVDFVSSRSTCLPGHRPAVAFHSSGQVGAAWCKRSSLLGSRPRACVRPCGCFIIVDQGRRERYRQGSERTAEGVR